MFGSTKSVGRWLAVAAAIGLICSSAALAKKPDKPPGDDSSAAYTIVPFLPPDFESVRSQVADLNETGQAVGKAELDGTAAGDLAVHLDIATGNYTVLQGGSRANGVNNLNQIVGSVLLESGFRAGFWAEPQAAPDLLPLLPGDEEGFALALNDDAIVVGDSGNQGVVWRVFVDAGGDVSFVDGPVPLPPLAGDTKAWGLDVNELIDGSFQVTGYSHGEDGPCKAVIWTLAVNPDGTLATPGPPVSLGALGLSDPSTSRSYGYAINTLGNVCGESDGMPFVAPAGQTAQAVPVPRNTAFGTVFDINNLGEIVGRLDLVDKRGWWLGPCACLWKDGDVIDLETQIDRKSGWDQLWGASVINDAGIITGYGRFDVESRGFLLIPSEP
jgi:hypothetical protein